MARVLTVPEQAARRSWRARLAAGPVGRRVAVVDLLGLRLLRVRGRAKEPVRRFSGLGEHSALWLVIGGGGILLDAPRRREWARALSVVVLAYLLNVALKSVLRRKRPRVAELPALVGTPTKLSFPSSHAASSFAAARAYSSLMPGAPLYAVATALAVSRVSLGVHFPTDIVVGAALGSAVGTLGRS